MSKGRQQHKHQYHDCNPDANSDPDPDTDPPSTLTLHPLNPISYHPTLITHITHIDTLINPLNSLLPTQPPIHLINRHKKQAPPLPLLPVAGTLVSVAGGGYNTMGGMGGGVATTSSSMTINLTGGNSTIPKTTSGNSLM